MNCIDLECPSGHALKAELGDDGRILSVQPRDEGTAPWCYLDEPFCPYCGAELGREALVH